MLDSRALANTRNLNSYRAWEREGFKRSGFGVALVILPVLVIGFTLFTSFIALIRTETTVTRAWVIIAVFAVYLVVTLGLMLFAVLRLNAWKKAHPWEPPASPFSWVKGA